MRTLLIAAASALFFAYAITELSMRLWPGEYFELLLLAFAALLVSGLLNLKLAGLLTSASQPAPARRDTRPRTQARDRGRPDKPANKPSGGDRPRGRDATQRSRDGRTPEDNVRNDDTGPAQPPPDGPRETGTVKWFNRTKGFGFVIRESGEEIFVHQRSVRVIGEGDARRRPGLKDGQSVTFVVAEREKGLQAEDVTPTDES